MTKNILFTLLSTLCLGLINNAYAIQKLTVQLDWFVNPDHAALIVAQQKGFFKDNHLEVELIAPADPSMPPKLVAAGKSDLAIGYQPQLYLDIDAGLPLVRIGTLIATPLNSLVVLQSSGIETLADLKGKKIGYSVNGFQDALLGTMLRSVNLTNNDIELVNVNWSLSPSLISGQVSAVIGAFRNFELNQMQLENHAGKAFYPEEHGVPVYDELIILANKVRLDNLEYREKLSAFMTALEQATVYIANHPDQAWQDFISYQPKELDTKLNQMAWIDTIPRLSLSPRALDNHRYNQMAHFMLQQGLIKQVLPLNNYARQLD